MVFCVCTFLFQPQKLHEKVDETSDRGISIKRQFFWSKKILKIYGKAKGAA